MKYLLLGLLALVSATAPPALVKVRFTALTQAAYLSAGRNSVTTKPRVSFPLRKQGHRLVIPTAAGRKVFTDVVIDETAVNKGHREEEATAYTYLGYLPTFRSHLIHVQLYEIAQWRLLTDAGQQLTLWGEPRFSPDGRYIAAACMGLEYAGGQPNALQLLMMRNSGLWEAWRLQPASWEPDSICWTTAGTLLLRQRQWPSEQRTYARLTLTPAP